MSTRAQVRFATREDGVSFSEHPEKIHAQFYVHSDGYPEGLGVEIAESVNAYGKINNWEIEDLCTKHGDLEYILNNIELSMYDFVMGSTIMCEMGMTEVIPNLRKGLDWFRQHNAEAYMVLLD